MSPLRYGARSFEKCFMIQFSTILLTLSTAFLVYIQCLGASLNGYTEYQWVELAHQSLESNQYLEICVCDYRCLFKHDYESRLTSFPHLVGSSSVGLRRQTSLSRDSTHALLVKFIADVHFYLTSSWRLRGLSRSRFAVACSLWRGSSTPGTRNPSSYDPSGARIFSRSVDAKSLRSDRHDSRGGLAIVWSSGGVKGAEGIKKSYDGRQTGIILLSLGICIWWYQ